MLRACVKSQQTISKIEDAVGFVDEELGTINENKKAELRIKKFEAKRVCAAVILLSLTGVLR